MVWDLGKAMRKKEEFESARLMDFEFRQRARAMRILAEQLQLDPSALAKRTVLEDDDAILAALAQEHGLARAELSQRWAAAFRVARRELIAERGDPTPHRLG